MKELSPGPLWRTSSGQRPLPALFEAGGNAFVCYTKWGFGDRARDIEAPDDLLFGPDLAQPFVVRGRKRLAGGKAGAGLGDAEPGGLVRPIGRAAGRAWRRRKALRHVVAVLQRQRILVAETERLAQGGSKLALILGRVEARFDRRLVPDRANATRG